MESKKSFIGEKSFEAIIKENYNYLAKTALVFHSRLKNLDETIEVEDLINDGIIGFHKALKTYNESKGKILNYCQYYIKYEMYYKYLKNNKHKFKKLYMEGNYNYLVENDIEENDIESKLLDLSKYDKFKLESIKPFITDKEYNIIKGIYFDKKESNVLSKELNIHRKNIWRNKEIALNKLRSKITL